MARRIASLLTALVLAGALGATGALGDGDPASDTLLGQNVFYPYAPPVSASIERSLNAETAAAKRSGFPIKVALIGRPLDLGVIPDLFGKPQLYAKFLDQEISFQGLQPLLVVMAAGYGVQGLSHAATVAVSSLHRPSGTSPTALAQAAETAVAHLAAASGHPVKGGPEIGAGSGENTSSSLPLIIALAAAALLVSGALVFLRRRQALSAK
ncbi:MAG: hypothetical protein ABI323_00215 [Solirubrobacteraceae bacterium]